jgi:2-polyprenyl-6-methoxyphenol hydroxylase-like FAD-dependent oxidoreductase
MELSRLGVDVRIVDRALEASSTSRALGVQARTVELLRPRGVGNELLRLGNRASATTLYADGQRLASIELHRMASEYNFILMLAQSETERLLAERLGDQGVTVERGVEFESLAQDEDMVEVVLRHSDGGRETLCASYVIAADGSHSPIRKALGLPFVGRSLTQSYVLGDVHLAGDVAADQLSIFLAPNGFLAIFPMGDGRSDSWPPTPTASPATLLSRHSTTFSGSTTAPRTSVRDSTSSTGVRGSGSTAGT